MSKFKKILAGLGIFIAILILLYIFFITPPGENILKNIIASKIGGMVGQPTSIGKLNTDLFTHLTIRNLKIGSEEMDSNKLTLTLSEIKVRYNLIGIITSGLYLDSIVADSIGANVYRDSLGNYNIPMLNQKSTAKPDTASGPVDFGLSIGTLSMPNINLTYNDTPLHLKIEVDHLSLKAKGKADDRYDITTKIQDIQVVRDTTSLAINDFAAAGQLTPKGVTMDTLSGTLGEMAVSGNASLSWVNGSPISGSASIKGKPNPLLFKLIAMYDLPQIITDSEINLRVTADGTMNDPDLHFQLTWPSLQVVGTDIKDIFVAANLKSDTLALDSLKLQVYGGVVDASGEFLIDSLSNIQLGIDIEHIDMAKLWTAVYDTLSPYKGKLKGNIDVAGKLADLKSLNVTANIQAENASYLDKALPDFYVDVNYADRHAKLKAHQPYFDISASGTINNGNISGNFSADIRELQTLAHLANFAGLSGKLKAGGEFSGTFDSPDVSCNLSGTNIKYRNFPIDSINGSFLYKDSILIFDRLDFSGQLESINESEPPFGIDSLGGGFSYSGWVDGSIQNLRGDLQAKLDSPSYGHYMLDTAFLKGSLNGHTINIDSLTAKRDSLSLMASGDLDYNSKSGGLSASLQYAGISGRIPSGELNARFKPLNDREYSITASGDNIELSHFSEFIPAADVSGVLRFNLDFTGNRHNLAFNLACAAGDLKYQNLMFDSLVVDVSLRNMLLHVTELNAFTGSEKLVASGKLKFEKDDTGKLTITSRSNTSGKASFNDLDISVFNRFMSDGTSMAGFASLDLSWNGDIADPHITGWFNLSDGQLILYPEATPIDSLNLKLDIRDSTLVIKTASASLSNTPLALGGSLTINEARSFKADISLKMANEEVVSGKGNVYPENVDFSARIDSLDLSRLQPFIGNVQNLHGVVQSSLNITGKLKDPVIDGRVELRNVGFKPASFNSEIDSCDVVASFNKDKIDISSLKARVGKGTISGSGSITHDNATITAINSNIKINEVKINHPQKFIIYVKTANLKYIGQKEEFHLTGNVQFGESKILINFNPKSILPWSKSAVQVQPAMPRYLEDTKIDVRIEQSDKLWLDNNIAHLRFSAALEILGSPVRPNLNGQVKVEEGYVLYLDRKFKVTEGVLYFADPDKINPDINLQAEAQVTNYQGTQSTTYTITFKANGKLDDLKTSLTSNPPLDQPDIVALLTLGATRSQLTGGASGSDSGGTQNALIRRAEALSSGVISSYIGQKVGTYLGLDQVSVQGNLFSLNEQGGAQLVASKNISQRAKLTYQTTVGHLNEQSIKLNYQLTKRFSVEGQTDRQGNSNIDLIYGLKFR